MAINGALPLEDDSLATRFPITNRALAYQILAKSVNPRLNYRDLTIFSVVVSEIVYTHARAHAYAVRHLGFDRK